MKYTKTIIAAATLLCLSAYAGSSVKTPATITVNLTDANRKKIHPELMGINHTAIGYNFSLQNPEIVKLFKRIKVPLLRYPGGGVANFLNPNTQEFVTTEEVFPQTILEHPKMRSKLAQYAKKRAQRPGNHRESKLVDFMDEINSDGAIIRAANVVSAKTEDFIAWFQRSVDAGETGKKWELGCEVYWDFMRVRWPTMADYYQEMSELSKEMKKIDPTCKVGAVVTHFPYDLKRYDYYENVSVDGHYNQKAQYFKKQRLEMDEMLLSYYENFDALIVHSYCYLEEMEAFNKKTLCDYLFMWSDDVVAAASDYYRNKYPGREIWVTEWNVMNNETQAKEKKDQRKDIYVRKQLIQPLWQVNYVANMMEHPDVFTAGCIHDFSSAFGWGFVQDKYIGNKRQDGEFVINPQYYAFVILSDFFYSGETSAIPDYTCDTFDGIKEYEGAQYRALNLRVSYNEAGEAQKLLFINKTDQPETLEVVCQGTPVKLEKMLYFGGEDPVPFWRKNIEHWFEANQEIQDKEIQLDGKTTVVIPAYSAGTIDLKNSQSKEIE